MPIPRPLGVREEAGNTKTRKHEIGKGIDGEFTIDRQALKLDIEAVTASMRPGGFFGDPFRFGIDALVAEFGLFRPDLESDPI
ncbi:MAG: hypothetical protein A4E19_00770 [Nitrospira sp. SG-bin1]|nr:MAG: hypothetical protein A4E19_00770 [Nitrospira sp. SG-bin1]